ncbi:MAG: helix-turn-helix transcriptional regulator, partial [Bacteroidota bacterium]
RATWGLFPKAANRYLPENGLQFSVAIGVKGSTINNIVAGRKSKPSYEVLRKIAAHFPVNTDWLLLGKGPMLPDTGAHLDDADSEVAKIASAIVYAPEKFKQNPIFANFLENERHKAVIAYYDRLLKSGMVALDFPKRSIPQTKTD